MEDTKGNNKVICINCKKEIVNSGNYCPECGKPIKDKTEETSYKSASQSNSNNSALSIIGFICSLCGIITCGISSFAGLIISIIASHDGSKKGQREPLATAGIIISAIILGFIFLALKYGDYSSINNDDYTLVESHISNKSNMYYTYIDGSIRNNKSRDLSYIQVTFTLYDDDGNTIGTCMDNNSGLDANGTWSFSAICSGESNKISGYKLKSISGW